MQGGKATTSLSHPVFSQKNYYIITFTQIYKHLEMNDKNLRLIAHATFPIASNQ